MLHITSTKSFEKLFFFFMFIVVCAFSFSCAKKPSGVRAQVKKTAGTNLDTNVSTQSEQQARNQSLDYKIVTVSTPNSVDGGFTIDSDLQNPERQFIPITTRHENGTVYSKGSFNDSARGVTVQIEAECFGSDCYKYLLLISVKKNNQTVYQTAALSFKCDDTFYAISVAQGVASFFNSIDDLNGYVEKRSYTTKNDCASAE